MAVVVAIVANETLNALWYQDKHVDNRIAHGAQVYSFHRPHSPASRYDSLEGLSIVVPYARPVLPRLPLRPRQLPGWFDQYPPLGISLDNQYSCHGYSRNLAGEQSMMERSPLASTSAKLSKPSPKQALSRGIGGGHTILRWSHEIVSNIRQIVVNLAREELVVRIE